MREKVPELSEENSAWISTFPQDRIKFAKGEYGVTLHRPTSRPVVIVTELAGNPGRSVTNCIEDLAVEILARYRIERPGDVVWVEHYERRSDLHLVEMAWDKDCKQFGPPLWRPLDDSEITTLRRGVAWVGGPEVPDWF